MPPTQKAVNMEKWKDIPGYDGVYEASTYGQIRTAYGKTTYTERHGVRHWKQRILKQKYQKRDNGNKADARVSLWLDGKERTWLVSRLIAKTWCAGYGDGLTVNHIDGNPMNNHADNLDCVTLSENIRHGFETGLYPQKKVLLISDDDGSTSFFRSMACASRFLGKNNGYISNQLKRGRSIRTCGYTIVLMS